MEFIEAIVIGLIVLLVFIPLLYVACIEWMDCEPEPSHRSVCDVGPTTDFSIRVHGADSLARD